MRYLVLTIALSCLAPAPALADEMLQPQSWRVDTEFVTDFPIHMGGAVTVNTPIGLRVSGSLGWLPPVYVHAINATVVAAGGYDDDTGRLIESSLSNSLVARCHLGWRPFASAGFYVATGYGYVTFGGDVTPANYFEAVTGRTLPDHPDARSARFEVEASLHMADVEIGWEWVIEEHLLIRTAIGGAFTFSSTSNVIPVVRSRDAEVIDAVERIEAASEAYLEEIMDTYVHTPVVRFGIGYAF